MFMADRLLHLKKLLHKIWKKLISIYREHKSYYWKVGFRPGASDPGFTPPAAEPGGYPAPRRVLPDFTHIFFMYILLYYTKRRGRTRKDTVHSGPRPGCTRGFPVKTPEVLGILASDRMPDLPRPIPNPESVRGLTGFCRICGVRVGTLPQMTT
jgi:hypothetical protein